MNNNQIMKNKAIAQQTIQSQNRRIRTPTNNNSASLGHLRRCSDADTPTKSLSSENDASILS